MTHSRGSEMCWATFFPDMVNSAVSKTDLKHLIFLQELNADANELWVDIHNVQKSFTKLFQVE